MFTVDVYIINTRVCARASDHSLFFCRVAFNAVPELEFICLVTPNTNTSVLGEELLNTCFLDEFDRLQGWPVWGAFVQTRLGARRLSLCSIWTSLDLSALRSSATESSTAPGCSYAQPGVVTHRITEALIIMIIVESLRYYRRSEKFRQRDTIFYTCKGKKNQNQCNHVVKCRK